MPLIAVFSDVHSNTGDLERALTYLQTRDVQAYLQLGDLGVESLRLLHGLPIRHCFGNWEVSTFPGIPQHHQAEIAAWPAQITSTDWIAAHATPAFPAECVDLQSTRRYMTQHRPGWMQLFPSLLLDENAIWSAFAALEEQGRLIAFHGHTHVQIVQRFSSDNRLLRLSGNHVDLPSGSRTLVGVGSVGSPRDGNQPRCVLFDTVANQVELIVIQ